MIDDVSPACQPKPKIYMFRIFFNDWPARDGVPGATSTHFFDARQIMNSPQIFFLRFAVQSPTANPKTNEMNRVLASS